MEYKPGEVVYASFVTQVFSTGVATNADSLPAGTLNRNGTDDGAVTVTVTNLATGRYKAVFTIPATYVPGDVLNLSVAATVSSVAGVAPVWSGRVGVGLLAFGTALGGTASTIVLGAKLGGDHRGRRHLVSIVSGTGAGQARLVSDYADSTRTATLDRNWSVTPDATSVYAVSFGNQERFDDNGVAQANVTQWNGVAAPNSLAPFALFTSGTVTDGAPTTSGFTPSVANPGNFNNCVLVFSPTSANPGYSNEITGSSGGKFTFYKAWPNAPVNGDSFVILGFAK